MASTSRTLIKSEPVDEDTSYCRCCFKLFTSRESPDPETDNLFKMFEEIICLSLEESTYASFFCFTCSVAIGSFFQFKKLATLKQEKFTEILQNNQPEDISDLFFLKLKTDPLNVIIKEEKGNMSKMRFEDFDDEPMEPPKSTRRSSKKFYVDVLTCPICSKKVDDVIEHLESCNGKQCDECKFRTVDADEMEQHKREKHGSKRVQKAEKAKRVRVDRIRIKEEVSISTPKIFQCDVCGKTLLNKGALVAHVSKHMKDKPLKCSMCSYSTTFVKYLKNHTKKMHDPTKEGKGKVRKITAGKCTECHKEYRDVKSHYERVHAGIKNFQCQECGGEYYSKNDLTSHMEHKHKHRLSVVDLTKYVCETCGKGFVRKQLLDLHKRNHLTLDFSCHLCEKKFAMKSRVEEHIKRSHLKIMEKECDVCGKRFYNNAKLKLHYNVHAGIKFHCFLEGCSASRSRRDAMVYHMKNDHQLSNNEREQFMEKLNAVCAQIKKR